MNLGAFLTVTFFITTLSLYFLSRLLTRQLSYFLYKITHRHRLSVYLMALLFLPGTLIHELAHAVVASMLFVEVGEIELWPEVRENSVKLGSVQVAHSGPLRQALIGFAPVFVGISIIISSLLIVVHFLQTGGAWPIWLIATYAYVLFVIGNTMFSSPKDLEGAAEMLLLIALLGIGGYAIAVYKFPSAEQLIFTPGVTDFILKANLSVLSLILADIIMIGLLKILTHR